MKKVLFCILLCISLVVSYAQETKRLYIQNLSVKNTKKNGKSWDFGGVQKGAPDILIQIYIKKNASWKMCFKSKTFKNTYTLPRMLNTGIDIKDRTYIKFEIFDADAWSNDKIGVLISKLSFTDTSVIKTFDQIKTLKYVLLKDKKATSREKIEITEEKQKNKKLGEEIQILRKKIVDLEGKKSSQSQDNITALKTELKMLKEQREQEQKKAQDWEEKYKESLSTIEDLEEKQRTLKGNQRKPEKKSKDYEVLKEKYDTLSFEYDDLKEEKERLEKRLQVKKEENHINEQDNKLAEENQKLKETLKRYKGYKEKYEKISSQSVKPQAVKTVYSIIPKIPKPSIKLPEGIPSFLVSSAEKRFGKSKNKVLQDVTENIWLPKSQLVLRVYAKIPKTALGYGNLNIVQAQDEKGQKFFPLDKERVKEFTFFSSYQLADIQKGKGYVFDIKLASPQKKSEIFSFMSYFNIKVASKTKKLALSSYKQLVDEKYTFTSIPGIKGGFVASSSSQALQLKIKGDPFIFSDVFVWDGERKIKSTSISRFTEDGISEIKFWYDENIPENAKITVVYFENLETKVVNINIDNHKLP